MSADLHPAAMPPEQLLADCVIRRTRRSGPGGQRRNKVETAVVIEHRPSGVVAEANEARSASENQRTALFRLRVNLALSIRRVLSETHEPGPLWCSRCRGGAIVINPAHDDFPALLAEALDFTASCGMDVREAATRLGCTATQLVKLLKHEPRGLALVNQARRSAGLHALR